VTRTLGLFFLLVTTWLLWSGIYDHTLLLGLGLASCLGVVFLTRRMAGGDFEEVEWSVWARLVAYLPWLMWEITKANLDVSLCVLGLRETSPRLIRVRASQKTALGQVLYANSITLTPGTISLDVRDDEILVHALSASSAEGLQEGTMDRRTTWVEGGA